MKTSILTEEQIINRIKDIISKECYLGYNEKDGCYYGEIYADYSDTFEHDTIKKIFDKDNPRDYFYELMNDWCMDIECNYHEEITQTISIFFDEEDEDIYYFDYEIFIREWIHDNIYFNYPYDHYLNQSVNVDIIVDTGDANYDYTLNCVYPHYNGTCGETLSNEASIVWLTKQQGYTKTQLNKALRNGEYGDSKFLESLYEEILNCTTHMNALTFFVKMTLGECFDMFETIKERTNEAIILENNTSCGLYDPWNGAGSVLDIELEKDIELPIKYIDSALPDGCRGYGVGNIYGMISSFWKSNCVK